MNKRKQVVITGTGRAGTTLLVSIFTKLGMETGFCKEHVDSVLNTKSKGGLEKRPEDHTPHIIKSPFFYNKTAMLKNAEHVIIPIRDLKDSAKSRARIGQGNGGFWGKAKDVESQMKFNSEVIYSLMYILSELDVPFTLIQFPRLAKDADYLWKKLNWLFEDYNITPDRFKKIYGEAINKSYIHF
ncbi:MAG: hypothetical protein VX343_04225 [Thermodesulfobacteriota bacterium]|nr:hypothetical protein [Thermodesulfobacteriota bacterium]